MKATRMKKPPRPRPFALAYARVSTQEQAEHGASMDAQRAALTAEAEHRGWDCEIVDGDAGISAKNITSRPALEAGLDRLDAGEADYLLAIALDRVSRSVADVASLMERSAKHGWGLVSMREDLDTSSATGRLIVHIMSAIAEFSSSITAERVRFGMAQRAKEGVRFGRPRDLDPAIRERIAQDFDAGISASDIARNLTDEGVPTARGGQWWPGSVRAIALAAASPAPTGKRKDSAA